LNETILDSKPFGKEEYIIHLDKKNSQTHQIHLEYPQRRCAFGKLHLLLHEQSRGIDIYIHFDDWIYQKYPKKIKSVPELYKVIYALRRQIAFSANLMGLTRKRQMLQHTHKYLDYFFTESGMGEHQLRNTMKHFNNNYDNTVYHLFNSFFFSLRGKYQLTQKNLKLIYKVAPFVTELPNLTLYKSKLDLPHYKFSHAKSLHNPGDGRIKNLSKKMDWDEFVESVDHLSDGDMLEIVSRYTNISVRSHVDYKKREDIMKRLYFYFYNIEGDMNRT